MTVPPAHDDRTRRSTVDRHLRPGERVLWEGGPDPGVVFARQDAFLVPFSLLWASFAAIWEGSAIAARTVAGAALGTPLVLFGLYIVAGRFVYKWRDRRRTRYAVTDQRAFVVRRSGRQVLDAPVGGPMAMLRRRDGRHGSVVWAVLGMPARRRPLTFSGGSTTMLRGTAWPMPPGAVVGQLAFFDVDRFDDLLAAVRQAREATGVTEPPRTLNTPVPGPMRGQPYGAHPYPGQPLGGPQPPPPAAAPVIVPRRPPAPPAGWYPDPDPQGARRERWWDGVGWTSRVRPSDGGAGGNREPPRTGEQAPS